MVLVDASAVTRGGLRTYVEGLLGGWVQIAPDDDLHIITAVGLQLPRQGSVTQHLLGPAGQGAVRGRLAVQYRDVPALVRAVDPEVLLATLPLVPYRIGCPSVAVVHDLRHEMRPHDFSADQRLARAVLYRAAYRRAVRLVAISERTGADLVRLHPHARDKTVVVPMGSDHALRWRCAAPRAGPVLAFAHFGHKDPQIALDVWRAVVRTSTTAPDLTIVGAPTELRHRLRAVVEADADLVGRVTVAPFLSDEEFGRLFGTATALLFPSRFEGFGLPALEAMRLDVPVVIGPEPALLEVADGHAEVAADFTAAALADAVGRALLRTSAQHAAARNHAAGFTWSRTAGETRAVLIDATST